MDKTVGVRYFSELTNMTILNRRSGRVGPHYGRTYGDQSFNKKLIG
jgi:hypothetical protein